MRKIPFLSAMLCAFVMLGSASAQTSPASAIEQNAAALLERHQAIPTGLTHKIAGASKASLDAKSKL